ncbi:MAG: DUF465 domain-containing protein [Proteobacteria bacterium]|nr:DUF465 domain-containing protein [Pseudomonadota bacterium]
MNLKPHTLLRDFPEMQEKIHALKKSDKHFAMLSDKYDALDHSIHQMESGVQPFTDEQFEEAKKKRLKLKDELLGMLKK